MNPRNPLTWDDLSRHPAFSTGKFDPNWYEGDVKEDLVRLQNATIAILDAFPTWSCELIVLDDCTMFVKLDDRESPIASLYPAVTDDFKNCFFLDIEGHPAEIRPMTPVELIEILRTNQKVRNSRV